MPVEGRIEQTFTAASQTSSETLPIDKSFSLSIQGTFTGGVILERKVRSLDANFTWNAVRTFYGRFEGVDSQGGEPADFRLRSDTDFTGTAYVRLSRSQVGGSGGNIFVRPVGGGGASDPVAIIMAQIPDPGNSAFLTSASPTGNAPGNPWTGVQFATTSRGIQECISIVTAINTSTGALLTDLGFTFTFSGLPEGIVVPVTVPNLNSKRKLHTTDWLSNQWTNYQAKVEPSRPLVANEALIVSTRHSLQAGNKFLYPLDYEFLEDVQTAGLTRTLASAVQPDGDVVNARADGTVFEYVGTLAAGGFMPESPLFDSDGWAQIEIVITSNGVSAADGARLYYCKDVEAATSEFIPPDKFTYGASDVTRGQLRINRGVALDGFKFGYQNGGSIADVYIAINVRTTPAGPPLNTLESSIDGTSQAQMARTALFAKNPSGTYDLIGRGALGGEDVCVTEHEVSTPIKSDTGIASDSSTVGTGGSKIIDSTNIPLGATGVQIKAAKGNNQVIYIAESQAQANATNAGDELDAGQGTYISIGTGLTHDIWAASASGTQRYRLLWTKGGGA